MLHYIIQTIAFQVFFLLVFDLFLKRETFFNYNRAYLLITTMLSLILPFIKIESFEQAVPEDYIVALPELFIGKAEETVAIAQNIETLNERGFNIFSWNNLLYLGWIMATLYFAYKLSKLIGLIRKSIKLKYKRQPVIILKNNNIAFSFFNYIFLGDNIKEEEKEAIIAHELIHVKHKHSLDLLFFEMLRILFWFNPLIYIYQKRIANVHEFIADAGAIKYNDKKVYYEKLLLQIFDTKTVSFINPFFKESLIKKRIIMLSKTKSKQVNTLKYALLIPMIIGMLVYTSCNQNTDDVYLNNDRVENKDLDQYTVSKNLDSPQSEESIARSRAANKFLYLNEDYVSWIFIDYKTNISTSSVHHVSEIAPEGYEELRTEIPGHRTHVAYRKMINQDQIPIQTALELAEIDESPIFPGCETLTSEEEKKKCLQESINALVTKEFDTNLEKKLGFTKTKFTVRFTIGKDGIVKNIKCRAPAPELQNEAIRVVGTFPQLIPGKKDGKPVDVLMLLPIAFDISE